MDINPTPGGKWGRQKKNNQSQQITEFNINWVPQKRQLRFLEACGLSHPFRYYLHENEEGKPKIFKRRGDYPSALVEPEARVIGYGGAAGGG